jgi:sugar (glycoside-pentoside-hexuronide) transporter
LEVTVVPDSTTPEAAVDTAPEVVLPRLSMSMKIQFGLGDWVNTTVYGLVMTFLMFYLTDVARVSVGAVSLLFVIERVLGAVMDPVVGSLADRTRTRWGRYRPWILVCGILAPVMTVLCFTTPFETDGGKLVWAYTTYLLFMVFFNGHHIPYGSLMSTMTQHPGDRSQLAGIRLFCSSGIYWVITVSAVPLVTLFGADDPRRGYLAMVALFCAIAIPFSLNLFFKAREVVEVPKSAKMSLSAQLSVLKGNWPLIISMAGFFLQGILMYGRSAVLLYYFTYTVGDPLMFATFNAVVLIASMVGNLTGPWFSTRFLNNKGHVAGWSFIGFGIFAVINYWITPQVSLAGFYVLATFTGYFTGAISSLIYGCVPDTVEYGEWRNHVRVDGFVWACVLFFNKLGTAVVAGMIGVLLTAVGYVGGSESQAPGVSNAMNVLFSLGPGILAIITGFVYLAYRLDDKTYTRIVGELKERHATSGVEFL